MCIIAAKPAGVAVPDRDTMRTMWNGNRDGAGLMYTLNGQVKIEKGFMSYKAFAKKLDALEKEIDTTATPMVFHFRITTHGGTNAENTHPFPITDSIGALKKRVIVTDIGVAHNGIIHITPRRGISDTMEYIASQLAPLKRALPKFYENKHALTLIENAIQSRMAFLSKDGKITTVGAFIEDKGVLYSNSTFRALANYYRGTAYGYWGDWDDYDSFHTTKADAKKATAPTTDTAPWADEQSTFGDYGCRNLMWLEDTCVVRFPEGDLDTGEEYLIDESGTVYGYDWERDCAVELDGVQAQTAELTPVRFREQNAEPIYVVSF